MLATTQPRPPHLLHAYPTHDRPPQVTMLTGHDLIKSAQAGPSKGGGGIKGFLSRSRVSSPEPGSDPTIRSRLRAIIGDSSSYKQSQSNSSSGNSTNKAKRRSDVVGSTKETHAPKRGREEKHLPPRPRSPDQTKKKIQFGPSLLPAIQRGQDGKWQPPSLSRGSMSTSALALYAKADEDEEMPLEAPSRPSAGDSPRKHALSVMFDATRSGSSRPRYSGDETVRPSPTSPRRTVPQSTSASAQLSKAAEEHVDSDHPGSGFSWEIVTPKAQPKRETAVGLPKQLEFPSGLDLARGPPTVKPTPTYATRSRSDTATSTSSAQISLDHYRLRLATSFLIRALSPVIRGSTFVQTDKNAEMRRTAYENLTTLSRMEKGWGGDWVKAANTVGREPEDGSSEISGMIESRVRAVQVSERSKERERKVWVEAMKDGILLCCLLNHLFPAQPAHITRVNVSDDGIIRATNLTRSVTACQTVGLDPREIFGLADLQDASETSLGRVALTIISLARLAGPVKAAVARSRSPSRVANQKATTSPSGSPRGKAAVSPPVSRPPSRDGTILRTSTSMPRSSTDAPNELHARLSIDTKARPSTIDDPSFRTPTNAQFSPVEIVSPRRQPLPRSTTQPTISPSIRPKSPVGTASPSRSTTPIGRPLPTRPTLRPRHTIGSKIQVSFADADVPSPPRSAALSERSSVPGSSFGLHSRERTPSLISTGSRVTSGYTRTSTAYSIGTVTADDHSGVAVADGDSEFGDEPVMTGMRERRMSEKTLHIARQKILGTLLSSEDLPEDLRLALENGDSLALTGAEEARGVAISQSLAALEGMRSSSARPSVNVSPRHRASPRPLLHHNSRSGEVPRVNEEDEASSAGGSSIEGSRPSVLRRGSGKIYVPKRSTSPSPLMDSRPTSPTRGLPMSMQSAMLTSSQSTNVHDRTRISKMERRQSEGYGTSHHSVYSDRPQNPRINSMVDLSTMSSSGGLSGLRDSSMSGTRISQNQPLQIIEFSEPGLPPIKYQLGNCIGRGQFGSVYRSLNLSSGQMVAIKRIRLAGMKEDEVKDVMSEVELLKRLSHYSIVKYEGMSRDEEYLNIVLEFVENGSLGQTLKAFGKFNEKLVSSYVAKILEGLAYLHSQGVVHCDLKAANILSTKNGNIKLSDFGVSLNMKAVENFKQEVVTASRAKMPLKPVSNVAGTPHWMAPEVISLNGASPASDIWSLGCTIIELLTGKPPYSDITNSMTVLFRIVEDDLPPLPEGISPELVDFLKHCFVKDPRERPAALVLFEHPWVKALNPDVSLRPQDSLPFLRRVSMDMRHVDSSRLFSPETSRPVSRAPSMADTTSDAARKRFSFASSHGKDGSETDLREHNMIKTTFGKAILCRICHASVKKAGVLCQNCGLICHTHCVNSASSRCDIGEQMTLLARQQEYLSVHGPQAGPSAASSRRSSFYTDEPFDIGGTPFTALPGKLFYNLKRSKTNLGSSIDLHAEQRRQRKSSSNYASKADLPPGAAPPRPALDPLSNGAGGNGSFSRASVFTDSSDAVQGEVDGRRRSAIRFDLDSEVVERGKEVAVGIEVVKTVNGGTPMSRKKSHQRAKESKDSKSDCAIM